jgi:hypothetical protein
MKEKATTGTEVSAIRNKNILFKNIPLRGTSHYDIQTTTEE